MHAAVSVLGLRSLLLQWAGFAPHAAAAHLASNCALPAGHMDTMQQVAGGETTRDIVG
jgi:hypothetical protein